MYKYYEVIILVIYFKEFNKIKKEWMVVRKKFLIENIFSDEKFLNWMIRLINFVESYDVRYEFDKIKVFVMIVGVEEDYLILLVY